VRRVLAASGKGTASDLTPAPVSPPFKVSNDPLSPEKTRGLVGLYLDPQEHAIRVLRRREGVRYSKLSDALQTGFTIEEKEGALRNDGRTTKSVTGERTTLLAAINTSDGLRLGERNEDVIGTGSGFVSSQDRTKRSNRTKTPHNKDN